jgi:hypothetical protein
MHDVIRSRVVETRRTAMRQQSWTASRLRADDPVMRRWLADDERHARKRMRSVPNSHRLEGENPVPHARQERQASSVRQPLEGRQRPKKPGPSLL